MEYTTEEKSITKTVYIGGKYRKHYYLTATNYGRRVPVVIKGDGYVDVELSGALKYPYRAIDDADVGSVNIRYDPSCYSNLREAIVPIEGILVDFPILSSIKRWKVTNFNSSVLVYLQRLDKLEHVEVLKMVDIDVGLSVGKVRCKELVTIAENFTVIANYFEADHIIIESGNVEVTTEMLGNSSITAPVRLLRKNNVETSRIKAIIVPHEQLYKIDEGDISYIKNTRREVHCMGDLDEMLKKRLIPLSVKNRGITMPAIVDKRVKVYQLIEEDFTLTATRKFNKRRR